MPAREYYSSNEIPRRVAPRDEKMVLTIFSNHAVFFEGVLDLGEGFFQLREEADVDRNPLGRRDHFIGALGHRPCPDIHEVVALEFTDTDADLLELVLFECGDCFVHLYPPVSRQTSDFSLQTKLTTDD